MSLLEICSVVLSFVFLILLIRQNVWCWVFGITSSILSAILFYKGQLYSECVLYAIYALLGFYGWYVWGKENAKEDAVLPIRVSRVLSLIILGIPVSFGIGYLSLKIFEDASLAYLDAATSTFGLIATYLEAHKYLSAWVFWIVLNMTTAIMYYVKGFYLYAPLMLVYFVFSIVGFISWRKLVVQ